MFRYILPLCFFLKKKKIVMCQYAILNYYTEISKYSLYTYEYIYRNL